MSRQITISAVGSVKNCLDILSLVLATLKRQGVEDFYVIDHGSTDGTSQYLAYLQSQGLIHVACLPESGFYQSAFNTGLARIAADQGADWVIPFDSDEFFLTSDGKNFQDSLMEVPNDVVSVSVPVQNYVQEASIVQFDYEDMSTARFRAVENFAISSRKAQKLVSNKETSFLCMPFPRKVIFRASPNVVVHEGNHGVSYSSRSSKAVASTEIRIAHLPYRGRGLMSSRKEHGQNRKQSGFGTRIGWQSQLLADLPQDELLDYWHSVTWHAQSDENHSGLRLVLDGTLSSLKLPEDSPFRPPSRYPEELPDPDLNDLLLVECLKRIGTDLRDKDKRDKLRDLLTGLLSLLSNNS